VFEKLKNNVMGTPEQNAAAAERNDKYIKAKMAQKAAGQKLSGAEEMALKMGQMGQKADAFTGMGAVSDYDRSKLPNPGVGNAVSDMLRKGVATPGGMKKGGKAKKACK
jgi:hypothetical protein